MARIAPYARFPVSYVVSLRKDGGITGEELRSALESDAEITLPDDSGDLSDHVIELAWQSPEGDSRGEYFVLAHGAVTVTTPSEGALKKLPSLAGNLGAEVIEEEGEDLGDVEVQDIPASGCGPAVWTVIAIVTFLLIYWVID